MTGRGFARGLWAARRFHAVFLIVGLAFSAGIVLPKDAASAASSSYGGYTWSTDRSEPAVFETLNSFAGKMNVLHIQTFDTNTVPSNAGFYQTEGRFTLTNNPVGNSFISGDLYIPASLATSAGGNYVNIGLWGVLGVPPTTAQSYPIINFYNGPSADPAGNPTIQTGVPTANVGEIRVWDGDRWIVTTGVNAITNAGVINYGQWNTLRLNYMAGATPATSKVDVVLNGTVIYTLGCPNAGSNACVEFLGGPIDPNSASLYEIILNSRTNGVAGYDVYWANILASIREEYYALASVQSSAIVIGDLLLGTYVDRRGLDWDGMRAAWLHGVGGTTSFNNGNGKINGSLAGAQFGLDLLALGSSSTRLGVTASYGALSSTIGSPGGGSGGSSVVNSTGIGGYITHASGAFYADLLSQYRFLSVDLTTPMSSGKVTGGSIDVAAEAGANIAIGDSFTLTPFGQLVYQHVMLNDTTFGGFSATFANSDALIGRARLLAQLAIGGIKAFASVGASTDFLGPKQVTVSGTTFTSNTGGPRAEFTAGLEGMFGAGFAVFGSGEFDITFDGTGQTYLGKAGVRKEF